jgi:alkanesulfonate monooxygenase SsuD/methylene tetrahydromethanopterin reductase-like flavin-dependent oxidoreductase (luciferase family)
VAARQVGYRAGPENRGYLLRVHVQDSEEKALRNGREFLWMQGEFTGIGHPYWFNPPGYSSAAQRRASVARANGLGPAATAAPFEQQLAKHELIAGTPQQVIDRLRVVLENTRPGILALWANDGKIDHADSLRCIELMGKEVLPALREIGRELGLHDPFSINAPISLAQTPRSQLNPQPDFTVEDLLAGR